MNLTLGFQSLKHWCTDSCSKKLDFGSINSKKAFIIIFYRPSYAILDERYIAPMILVFWGFVSICFRLPLKVLMENRQKMISDLFWLLRTVILFKLISSVIQQFLNVVTVFHILMWFSEFLSQRRLIDQNVI